MWMLGILFFLFTETNNAKQNQKQKLMFHLAALVLDIDDCFIPLFLWLSLKSWRKVFSKTTNGTTISWAMKEMTSVIYPFFFISFLLIIYSMPDFQCHAHCISTSHRRFEQKLKGLAVDCGENGKLRWKVYSHWKFLMEKGFFSFQARAGGEVFGWFFSFFFFY